MKPSCQSIPAERLLPHRPPMLALRRLVDGSRDHSRAELSLENAPCFEEGRFRGVWCLELMAQAVAAGVAFDALVSDAPRELAGFVVGVEEFEIEECSSLAHSVNIEVEAHLDIEVPPAEELTARVLADGRPIATGRIRMLVGGARPLPMATAPQFEGFLKSAFSRLPNGRFAILPGAGHPYLEGHFPGAPVLPAIGHLRFVEHAASIVSGRDLQFARIGRARFLQTIAPGDELELALEVDGAQVDWTFRCAGRPVSKGSGWLREPLAPYPRE